MSGALLPPDRVPARVLERLAAIGVHSLADWKRLGRRRCEIFGIVPSVVRLLDELASETTTPVGGESPAGVNASSTADLKRAQSQPVPS